MFKKKLLICLIGIIAAGGLSLLFSVVAVDEMSLTGGLQQAAITSIVFVVAYIATAIATSKMTKTVDKDKKE